MDHQSLAEKLLVLEMVTLDQLTQQLVSNSLAALGILKHFRVIKTHISFRVQIIRAHANVMHCLRSILQLLIRGFL